ncbi:MAG TPA: IS630 family transposase [Isosphaeraceae bacterium]|nr:IS630 family transposase [Isosphaeraceae bacterium]
MHAVKIARERPDDRGRSLSRCDCTEIARQPVRDGVVGSISAGTVRQILLNHRPKPWRLTMWLSAKLPRDAAFAAQVREICDLDPRPVRPGEVVLCVDERAGLQPRPRKALTLAAKKDRPPRVEREYGRCGAVNLFAAFDTRTGKVYGHAAGRKRQAEFIAFLEQLDREIPASVKTIHIVLDSVRMHKGKRVQAWLARHPRFVFHHPPVHCSWMNQVEQWFGILKRKRLRIADFADKERLAERLMAVIGEWNEVAHPFNWTSKSVAKIMAKCRIEDAEPLAAAA